MTLFSIWPSFGFSENPYSNTTLAGDEVGDALLVGRDAEVHALHAAIGSGGLHPSVEGMTGVGKSSLIAVAGYRMFVRSLDAKQGVLFLPASRFFQMSANVDLLESQVYLEVAQTLIANVEAFRACSLDIPDIAGLSQWLNEPDYHSRSAQISLLGGGLGSVPNSSDGFVNSGLPQRIRAELERCFPAPEVGGIICVLDNLELLQTVGDARDALERMRDRLFTLPGLRWVLCGSRGLVSRARTDRLSGIFSPPIDVGPLDDRSSIELIERRIAQYAVSEAYAPVEPEGFDYLYHALHFNLRDALAMAQTFSNWMYTEYVLVDRDLPQPNERRDYLEAWLATRADQASEDARAVQPRVWDLFDRMANEGGIAPSSRWSEFGFNTQQQMTAGITQLVEANLAEREIDPDDGTKRIARLTPTGWLVHFDRSGYVIRGDV